VGKSHSFRFPWSSESNSHQGFPMKCSIFSTLFFILLAILPAMASLVTRQNTPQFYLVSSSSNPAANLKVLLKLLADVLVAVSHAH